MLSCRYLGLLCLVLVFQCSCPPPPALLQSGEWQSVQDNRIVVNSAFMEHSSTFTQDNPSHRTPVLLITDLGRDIDDTCALLALCSSPELELVGVVTCGGNSEARAKVLPCFIYVPSSPCLSLSIHLSYLFSSCIILSLFCLVLVSAFACLVIR